MGAVVVLAFMVLVDELLFTIKQGNESGGGRGGTSISSLVIISFCIIVSHTVLLVFFFLHGGCSASFSVSSSDSPLPLYAFIAFINSPLSFLAGRNSVTSCSETTKQVLVVV